MNRIGYMVFASLYCRLGKYKLTYSFVRDKVQGGDNTYGLGFAFVERSRRIRKEYRLHGEPVNYVPNVLPNMFIQSGHEIMDQTYYRISLSIEDTMYNTLYIPESKYQELIRGLLDVD